jgi:hypothetical protein
MQGTATLHHSELPAVLLRCYSPPNPPLAKLHDATCCSCEAANIAVDWLGF